MVGFKGRERTSPERKAESKVELRREEMWVGSLLHTLQNVF